MDFWSYLLETMMLINIITGSLLISYLALERLCPYFHSDDAASILKTTQLSALPDRTFSLPNPQISYLVVSHLQHSQVPF